MKLMLALTVIVVVLSTATAADDDAGAGVEDYIHLPGKNCDDAPPCPDERPCVMAPPHCNVGTCGKDPVPTCGKKP
ncbi:rhs-related protein [Lasius niger]|uniref:Rhs-related protein n=1 Tax=Lasius niger TaxID=67767 RepID=A0A0J7KS93_LASNI|nr:rhs-related protein [Lasius niger]